MGMVSLRPFFAILIAAAMMLSPFAMRSGMAMAAAPADHHTQTAADKHCGSQSGDRNSGKVVDKGCCAAMCANIVLPAAAPAEPIGYARGIDQPMIASIGASFLTKLPTPPPRAA